MYLDTCILTKLFVPEVDSEAYATRTEESVLVTSELAYAEIYSSFLRKERLGEITRVQRETAWARFERQIQVRSLYLAPLNGAIVRKARDLMHDVHPHVPLRTLDSIHLATYLSVLSGPFLTNDRRMREAATLL